MFNDLLNFKSKKDRNDFFIALVVLAFFGWLLYWLGFSTPFDEKIQANLDANAVHTEQLEGALNGAKDALNTTAGALAINELNPHSNTSSPSKTAATGADRDGDGVADDVDKCPNEAGSIANNGCPKGSQNKDKGVVVSMDSDGDGVADDVDKCPNEVGSLKNNGCPKGTISKDKDTFEFVDSDGDGIRDVDDKCPTVAGIAANKGCPEENSATMDSDGDGILDLDDKCPNKAGLAKNGGCPTQGNREANVSSSGQATSDTNTAASKDTDGDGINDLADKCPNEAGLKNNNGCPKDSDGDGVNDAEDKCPNKAGLKNNNGCPKDSDGDGVNDAEDKCPNKAGLKNNNGCPEVKVEKEERAALEKAIKSVEFNTNRATLKGNSASLLDEIVTILKKYPKYKLDIAGHTDDVGKDADNLKLSESRAKTCFDYLAKKGIDKKRLSFKGFGESKPITSNATAAGKRKNRRVAFVLYE